VLSVDWFMGIARALGNLIGNCVATVVVAAWEGDIDRAQAHRVLNGEAGVSTEELLGKDEGLIGAPVAPAATLVH
jgi:aerobic C4-dicarboxylate transport protein